MSVNRETLDALLAILPSDTGTWRSVAALLEEAQDRPIATVNVRGDEEAAVSAMQEALTAELAELGLEGRPAKPGHIITESVEVVVGAAAFVGAIHVFLRSPEYLNKSLQALTDLPDSFKGLVERYLGSDQDVIDENEVLALGAVAEWMTSKYGLDGWASDPEETQVTQLADVVVVYLLETSSQTRHLLAVRDSDVAELPLSALPPMLASRGSGS